MHGSTGSLLTAARAVFHVCIAARKKFFPRETQPRAKAYFDSQHYAGFILCEVYK